MSVKYLVSKSDINKLVKRIKKHSDLKPKEIFEDLVKGFGFSDSEDYVGSIKEHKSSKLVCRELEDEDLVVLSELEQSICERVSDSVKDNFDLKKIDFINDIIKSKVESFKNSNGGYSLSTYLALYPFLFNQEEGDREVTRFISREFLVREKNLEKFVYNLLARYRAAKIPKFVFSKFIRTKKYNDKDMAHLKKHELIELKSFLLNKKINSAEEFLMPLVYQSLFEPEIEVGVFVAHLRDRIKREHKFYKKVCEDAKVQVPIVGENKKMTHEQDFLGMQKLMGDKDDCFLGLSTQRQLLQGKQPLILSKERMLENTYIVGDTGYGVESGYYSALMSNIRSGAGFLAFNTSVGNDGYLKVLNLAKLVGREKDVLYFNQSNIESISADMIKSFVLNQKLVYIEFDDFHDVDSERLRSYCVKIFRILKHLDSAQSNYSHPFTLAFCETSRFLPEVFKKIRISLLSYNMQGINLIMCDNGMRDLYEEKRRLLNLIENILVFNNQSDVLSMHLGLDRKLLKDLNVREFLYFYSKKMEHKNKFKSPIYLGKLKENYINFPFEK